MVPRVLIAEDDRSMLDALSRAFEQRGRTVVRAECGAEMVERLAEDGPFDLIVADVRMPWMNGLQAAIAARNAGLRMPIILISALDDARVATQVRALGPATVLLKKPFRLAELEATVARLLPSAA